MGVPEIIAAVSGSISVVVAVATVIWYVVQSSSNVKQREFGILRETVDALDTEAKRLRADLRAAEQKIEDLEGENRSLRADLQAAEQKIEDLEQENRDLRRGLATAG